ncbi:MAG: hypothetical protein AAGF11_38125 [Myxococcota bacterium]
MSSTTIQLSASKRDSEAVLQALAPQWYRLDIVPRALGELGSDDEGELSFTGPKASLGDWGELLDYATSHPVQAVQFLCTQPHDDLYLYLWTEGEEHRISVELGLGRLRHFESDDYPIGAYQVAVMLALAGAAEADVLAYGKRYQDLFVALEPAALLDELRAGTLLDKWTPAVHLFSTDIISKAEIELALRANDGWHLRHTISTAGYHVLSQYAGAPK